jgi:hypothetical protein
MFNNENELNTARAAENMDALYRGLVELGGYQLRSGNVRIGGFGYRVTDPIDKRDIIHEAACSLVIQIKAKPTKEIQLWSINMRYALKDSLKSRHKQVKDIFEFREDYGDSQRLYEMTR